KLPTHMVPLHYELVLKPHMYHKRPKTFTFNAFLDIRMKCVESSNNITLHARHVNIIDRYLKLSGSVSGPLQSVIMNWTMDRSRELLVIHLDSWMWKDKEYTLRMRYNGRLTNSLTGFYYSRQLHNSTKSFAAASQMEPDFARSVFPCFDEPAYKAHFNLTVIRRDSEKSLFNMPRKEVRKYNHHQTADIYETTPLMSTYQLAFIVGHLYDLPDTSLQNVKFRSWTMGEKQIETNLALDISVLMVKYLEKYFSSVIPLKKYDMVALPDVVEGDMTSWGLSIFRESNILYTPGSAAHIKKQEAVLTISRRLAHQWTNLVSPKSFNQLWFNKALGRFVAGLGIDHFLPTWQMTQQLIVEDLYRGLDEDALSTSHPLELEDNRIPDVYDPIDYHKGASVLKMLQFIMGERIFTSGIKKYIRNHAYKPVTTDALWTILTDVTKENGKTINVKGFMESWTTLDGYPVVMVNNLGGNKVKISQKKFVRDPCSSETSTSISKARWEIPFTFTSDRERYYNQTARDISKKKSSCPWIMGNIQQSGFYRVNYDDNNWICLLKQLNANHEVIPPIHRAQLIDDAMTLAASNMVHMNIAVLTLRYLDKEREYIPHLVARKHMDYIHKMLLNSSIEAVLSNLSWTYETIFVEKIFQSCSNFPVSIVTSNIDNFRLLRSLIISTACEYDQPECVRSALVMYANLMGKPSDNRISRDLRATIYCTAIRHGNGKEWNFAMSRFRQSQEHAEKDILLRAMACTDKARTLKRFLETSRDPEQFSKHDTLEVFGHIGANPIGRAMVWDMVKKDWTTLFNEFNGNPKFAEMIKKITSDMRTEVELLQVESFIEQHPTLGSTEKVFHQALENIKFNIRWLNNHYQTFSTLLNENAF
ncbi:hypothetical protein LOTGIDRAFT_140786, partial [Lottia gigantea]